MEKSTIASLEERVAKLQNELEEARDIIDELEFELESVSNGLGEKSQLSK